MQKNSSVRPAEHYTAMLVLVISMVTTFLMGMLLTETLWGQGLNYFGSLQKQASVSRSLAAESTSLVQHTGWPVQFPVPSQPIDERMNYINADGDPLLEAILVASQGLYILDSSGEKRFIELRKAPPFFYTPAAVGDVTGDDVQDIIMVDNSGTIFVLSNTGEVLNSWSTVVSKNPRATEPVLANLDLDPELEILVYVHRWESTAFVQAYNSDGSVVTGWSSTGVSAHNAWGEPVSVGDVDGDSLNEVVYIDLDKNGWHLVVLSNTGRPQLMSKVYIPAGYTNHYTEQPVIADLDADGKSEIVIASPEGMQRGKVYVYHGNGALMNGWPREIRENEPARPTVADIDGDGDLEILTGWLKVHAFHHDGTYVAGFPWAPVDALRPGTQTNLRRFSNPEILVANVDQDSDEELIAITAYGNAHAYDLDGSVIPGWPIGNDLDYPPLLIDFDGDRLTDALILEYQDYGIYKASLFSTRGHFDPTTMEWAKYRHDQGHTKNYSTTLLPPNIIIAR